MSAAPVVEPFDVLEYGVGEFDAGLPTFAVEQLDLHPRPECFGDGVVVGIADGPQGRQQSGLRARWVKVYDVNWAEARCDRLGGHPDEQVIETCTPEPRP
jgi:hypothetical protein